MAEFDLPAVELGPMCPVSMHAHSKTETAGMLANPGHTMKHGGLKVHVFAERSRLRVLVADMAGSGVSLVMPCPTDAIQMPDGHHVVA